MANLKSIFVVFLTGLILSGMGRADVMPLDRPDSGPQAHPHAACSGPDALISVSDAIDRVTDLCFGEQGALAEAVLDRGQPPATESGRCLEEEGASGLELCLYGLISLGLCQCRPWIKRVSLGIVPEWYHDGGPQQVRHRRPVLPGSDLAVQSLCFLQPVFPPEGPTGGPLGGRVSRPVEARHRRCCLTTTTSRGPPTLPRKDLFVPSRAVDSAGRFSRDCCEGPRSPLDRSYARCTSIEGCLRHFEIGGLSYD